MKGVVRSFVAEKGFGFIDGADGQSYFVHIKSVHGVNVLFQGQSVEFEPHPTPKGLSAIRVTAGPAPELIYSDPVDFIMTKANHVKGHEIVAVISENAWGESNSPNEAKAMLRQVAQRQGANAVVCVNMTRYTDQETCSNYRFTMHRCYGHPVVIKKPEYTTDPDKIAQWHQDVAQHQHAMQCESGEGETSLVSPPPYVLFPLLAFSWARTFGRILSMMAILAVGKLVRVQKPALEGFIRKLGLA